LSNVKTPLIDWSFRCVRWQAYLKMEIGGGYLFVKFIPKIIIMPAMDGGLRAACNEDVAHQ
jgi:hypothetical protein